MLFLILGFVMVFIAIYFIFLRERYQYFKRHGIPTPPFNYVSGHMNYIWSSASPGDLLREWTRKYGKTYGIYKGHVPTFVTSDLEFINQVFNDQFFKFPKHGFHPYGNPLQKSKRGLFSSNGAQWRRQRAASAHIIAMGIKEMSSKWLEHIEEKMKVLANIERDGKQCDIYKLLREVFFHTACE